MQSTARRLCLLFLFSLLAACGGGGGGGGSSNNSNSTLTLQNKTVNFTANIGQSYATPQTITGSISQPEERTYYLFVDLRSSNLVGNADAYITGNQGSITLYPYSTDNLEPGVHTGTITVSACLDASCSKHIKGSPQTVSIRYEVLYDAKVADVDRDGIVDANDPFPKVANKPPVITPELIYYADAGKPFSLTANTFIKDPEGDAISYRWSQIQGRGLLTGEQTGDTLSFAAQSDVTNAELQSFWVVATDAYGSLSQTRVDVNLLPALKYTASGNSFSTYTPNISNPGFTVQIDAHQASNWQLSSNNAKVTLSATQGTGSQLITGTIDATNLALGSNAFELTLTDIRQQIHHAIPIEVIASTDRPVVLKNGIALSKTGGTVKLSAEFEVLSERGDSAMAWTATTDQPWLSLSRTQGVAGDIVMVTADPTMLANDQQYRAEITLVTPGSSKPEKVTVGLYLSSATAAAQTTITSSAVMTDIVSDPTRPHVYTVAGNAKLYVYDVYSAAEIAAPTIGGSLNALAISHDGAQIFVFDSLEKRIFVLNTTTFAIEKQFSMAHLTGVELQGLQYLRPKGVGMLLVGGQSLIHATSGTILHTDYARLATTYVAASEDMALQAFASPSNHYDIYLLKLNTDAILGKAQLTATLAINTYGGYGFPIDFASNRDMSKIWISTGAQVETYSYSAQNGFTLLSNRETWPGWQNALESTSDYSSYYLGQDYNYVDNVCAYDTDLNIERDCINPPNRDVAIRMLKLSSDNKRGIVFSDSDYYDTTSQPITFFNALH